ncbi:MFS transporter [Actinorhabdospora filicis]|uniref:MFS transporter n=1 Tax=Actinorhabdospora filicis TaxID=1785913 RepID=A0A9W6SQI4_9ACTN|nr:MFS transporter [Actinorhabdospora filicis]
MTLTRPAAAGAARTLAPAPLLILATAPIALSANSPALILPTLATDLGVGAATVSWLVTAFGLAVAVGAPLMGGLARRFGVRPVLYLGGALTLLGTVLAVLTPWFGLLIAARALQALGGAAMVTSAMNLSGGIPRRMGAITAGFGVVGASGPLLGSVITQHAGWHLVFAVQAVTVLAVPVLARHATAPVGRGAFDATGAVLLAALVTGLVSLPHLPIAGLAVVAIAVALLVPHIRRRPEGFVPLALLRSRAFLGAAGLTLALSTSYFGLLYAVPRILSARTDWAAGLIGTGQMLALMAGSGISFVLAARFVSPVVVAAMGAAAPLLLLAPPALAFAAATIGVAASSTAQAVLGVRAMRAAPEAIRPAAIGLFNLFFQLGGAFGPTIVVMLIAA